MSAGIDYGRGLSNIDHATGIRYGVMSQHTVCQAWADSAEAEYGDPACPECGGAVTDETTDRDYYCAVCEQAYWSDAVYPEEPQGYSYDGDGYVLTDCLDSDIFVIKAPYFTYAPFCSPCVPGAGDLDSTAGTEAEGVKTYCLGPDWFEGGAAPYRMWRVDDGTEVTA